jgi:hypothetical protein
MPDIREVWVIAIVGVILVLIFALWRRENVEFGFKKFGLRLRAKQERPVGRATVEVLNDSQVEDSSIDEAVGRDVSTTSDDKQVSASVGNRTTFKRSAVGRLVGEQKNRVDPG